MEGLDDLGWATELISSMEFKESWWERLLARAVAWQMTRNSIHLCNFCLADDAIWLLSEELVYREKYNCQCIKAHDSHEKDAEAKMKAANNAAEKIASAKIDYVRQLHAGNLNVETIQFLRYDLAARSGTRANLAVTARKRSQVACPRRDTSDVLAIRRIISNVRVEYDDALRHLKR